MIQFFGWRCRRPICLQSCAKADNHGLTGTARCNKCRSGLARDAPRGRRSVSWALKISRQALREAPRGRRSEAREKLGDLEANEMYGFVPALVLGGSATLDGLQRLDAEVHLILLSQMADLQPYELDEEQEEND